MFYQTKTRLAIVSSLCVWLIERAASIRFTLFSEKPSLSPTLSRKQMLVRCIVLKHEIKIYFPLCVEVGQKQQSPEHHTPLKHSISFVFIFFLFFFNLFCENENVCFAKGKDHQLQLCYPVWYYRRINNVEVNVLTVTYM